MDPMKFIVSADEIVQGIWVGNEAASQDKTWLTKNRIHVIVNCTKHIPFVDGNYVKFRIPVNDPGKEAELEQSDVSIMFNALPAITKVIHEYRKRTTKINILIHCHAGMQRSATVCAAYISRFIIYPQIKDRRKSMDHAINLIIDRRPIAFNAGSSINFKAALDRFLLI